MACRVRGAPAADPSRRWGIGDRYEQGPSSCVFGKGQLYSELYFQDPDALVNEARFKAALAARETLEAAYGSPLTFEPLEGKKGSRIATYRAGSVDVLDQWDEYVAWFIAEQTSLRSAIAAIGGFAALDVG